MASYLIRTDIKIPSLTNHIKYPFAKMKIGDSFAVEPAERKRVHSAACMFGVRNKMKFTVRQIDPLTNNNYRCWRIR